MPRPLFLDKRFTQRKQLTGLLPAPLITESGDILDCKPVDISENGLGILSSVVLEIGDKLTLRLSSQPVEFTVAWGKRDFAKNQLYRYGLITESETVSVEDIFEKANCLK